MHIEQAVITYKKTIIEIKRQAVNTSIRINACKFRNNKYILFTIIEARVYRHIHTSTQAHIHTLTHKHLYYNLVKTKPIASPTYTYRYVVYRRFSEVCMDLQRPLLLLCTCRSFPFEIWSRWIIIINRRGGM